jgi:hypothetical protein
LDAGIAYLTEEYTQESKNVREYTEYYFKLFIPGRLDLLTKYLTGKRADKSLSACGGWIELPLHPLISPIFGYEVFDKDRLTEGDIISRIIYGIKYMVVPNTIIRLAHYINKEEKDEKNNLFSLMLIIWW